jgi:hypothetical protein
VGVLVLVEYLPGGVKMTCNKCLQNRPKNRIPTESDYHAMSLSLFFGFFFFRGPLQLAETKARPKTKGRRANPLVAAASSQQALKCGTNNQQQ